MDYYNMYRDIWLFHKEFVDRICGDDEFWREVGEKGGVLSAKYNHCAFITGLLVTELNEFERIYKEGGND